MSLKKRKMEKASRLESEPPSMSASDSTIAVPPQAGVSPSRKGKSKNKKRLVVLIILIFVVIYYVFTKFLSPQQIEKTSSLVEGEIKFNSTLSTNYTWITQKLDHSTQDQRTWNQRVLLNFEAPLTTTTPIFLTIPDLDSVKTPLPFQNFKQFCKNKGCLELALEPRYFGESFPLGEASYETSNMQYLTIEQMVQDIAYLIKRIQNQALIGVTTSNPWILVSSSKAAIIALLFRGKYPELSSGLYLSSPVFPEALVPEVSERLYSMVMSGGKKCRSVVHQIMAKLKQKAFGEQKEGFLLELGKGTSLKSEQALYFFMDRIRSFTRMVFITLCSSYSEEEILQLMESYLFYSKEIEIDPLLYSVGELKTPEQVAYFDSLRSRRAHQWLRCSEIGLFETYPSSGNKNINFKEFDQAYFRLYCYNLFEKDTWPSSDTINRFNEGVKKVTKVFVVHGHYDIWLPYAWNPQEDEERDVWVETLSCSSCSHNFDSQIEKVIYEEVDNMREKEQTVIQNWLKNEI